MIKFPLLFVIILILSSCLTGVKRNTITYDDLFNDRTSKVWVIDRVWLDNADISSRKNDEKDVMVFHKNGIVDLIAMKNITRRPPEKGEYELMLDNRSLIINYEDRVDIFNVVYATEDSILLHPKANSANQYQIQLKPFKEL